jgi:glycosyltransferase involved in cell wall biosynthesis
MNILMIISKNDKYGAQRVFIDQLKALRLMGRQVLVVGRGATGYIPDTVTALGVEYHSISMKGIKDLFVLRKLVREYSIDIIHTFLDRADYFGILLSCLTHRPVVSTMNVRRYHIGYRFADRVVTVSNIQKVLLMRNGVKEGRIRVVRPGIDIGRYADPDAEKRNAWKRKLNSERYSMVFCHISSLIPQKSHAISLDLITECKARGEEPLLVIAGDPLQGEYYDSLINKIADAGLQRNVYFTGWTTDLPEILALSHFTLLPSFHEAFGMVLLEGMAAGTPVVAREGEGGAELIEEHGTGFLFKPTAGGVPALAEEILALWHDRDNYMQFSNRCRSVATSEYSLRRFGERLEELYATLQ